MHGYLYIVSNPSMPGLIKIGRTTNLPSQRMAELHSTGVPTPFELEFCAEVDDCAAAERAAHAALAEHRVSSSREFFKTSVKHAIKSILPVLGHYTIYEVRETHGIAKLEEDHRRKQREAERRQAEEQERAARRRDDERRAKVAKVAPIVHQLVQAEGAIAAKGPKPVEDTGSGFGTFLWFCFFPVPIGWVVWLGTLSVFDAKRQDYGWVCVALLVAGYFVYKDRERSSEEHRKLAAPWVELENEIYQRKEELRQMGLTVEAAIDLVGGRPAQARAAGTTDANNTARRQNSAGHSQHQAPAVAPPKPADRPLWVNIHGEPMNPFAPREESEGPRSDWLPPPPPPR